MLFAEFLGTISMYSLIRTHHIVLPILLIEKAHPSELHSAFSTEYPHWRIPVVLPVAGIPIAGDPPPENFGRLAGS